MRESSKRIIKRELAGVIMACTLAAPLALLGSGGSSAPPAPRLAGTARVVDGDTIVVAAIRIRLEGIDAPETTQTCNLRVSGTWPCGAEATRHLADLIGHSPVTCDDMGLDKYGRTLGRCFVGTLNLNDEMVRSGHAWAFVRYSTAYVAAEAHARQQHAGIWQGTAMPAWEYRERSWAMAAAQAPNGCTIKGNVTTAGRIYHMPWSPWYDKIHMDEPGRANAKGKRWFCSEAEALAAGWRPALTR